MLLCRRRRCSVRVFARNKPETLKTGDDATRTREGGRTREIGVASAMSHISHARRLCFAWPRQYYYHIFHIMRPRVCLLFLTAARSRTRDRTWPEDRARLNVLSFIARAAAFLWGVASNADTHDEKFIRERFPSWNRQREGVAS